MTQEPASGLGELLRYVGELVDGGAEDAYRAMKLAYRPRYTPVLRALRAGAKTVTDITAAGKLTQGAISQTIALMQKDGLIARHALEDGRKSSIELTRRGRKLLQTLEPHWAVTFAAIQALEKEIGHPLRQILMDAAGALERSGFAERLSVAAMRQRGRAA
jgi:DNA-binding MarR family transcriptional regulator